MGNTKNMPMARITARITAQSIITSSGFMCRAAATFFSNLLGSSGSSPSISAESVRIFTPVYNITQKFTMPRMMG